MARSLTSQLYKLARLSASGRAVRKGYVGRRAKNIIVGRALGWVSHKPPRLCPRGLRPFRSCPRTFSSVIVSRRF
jgi:hypothetical protein